MSRPHGQEQEASTGSAPYSPIREPYFRDETTTLWHGDSLTVLRGLASGSVDCCVTSPPYFGLRDYGTEGQMGLEPTPAEYVENMRALFAEVRRVLADDGTLWLNIGDSYYSGKGSPGPNSGDTKQSARRGWSRALDKPGATWAKPKNLLGIPWRVAFALQDDGWTLRNDIIWAKPNAMPDSVRDRLRSSHEHIFMFSKSRRYWFDLDPIKVPTVSAAALRKTQNPGDVWTIPTQPFAESHFAVMPLALAERCVMAGCKPDGTVLDPFSGSGTTGLAAVRNGRRYVGVDVSDEYLDLSLRTRLAPPGAGGAAA